MPRQSAICPIQTLVYIAVSLHRSPDRLANRDTFGVKFLQTEDVHSVAVWRDALVVERINATDATKEMTSGQGVKLILGKLLFPGEKVEITLMYFNHHRVLEAADRTVTCRKLLEITNDLKSNHATVATTRVLLP